MKKTTKGFTIIELLVVIAIIGILTAIVTANFASSKAKSRDAKRVSDLAQIQLNFELFFDRCNRYPTSLNLEYTCQSNGVKVSNFMSVMPTDPTTKTSYTYEVNGDPATDYVLRAKLESSSPVLLDDVDLVATPLTTACTDASPDFYYCVQPK